VARSADGYKANLNPTVQSFGSFSVPFSNFTDFWDDATGNPIQTVRWWRRNVPAAVILTAAWLVCAQCSSNSRYCPDSKTLANMKTMSIWAEGVEGDINLQVKSVAGYGCTA
jgi:hypothetical protein